MNEEVAKRIGENKKSKDTVLDLSGLELTAIPAEVSELVWLTGLDLDKNQIGKIEGLNNLTSLRTLDLSQNQIGKIEGLNNLTNLQGLLLSKNQINKIEGLDNLTNLQILFLNKNQISKIEGLDNLANLQTLSLNENQIGKIEGLDNLVKLQTLFLSENQIGKIEGLDNLTNLQTLDLSQNQIGKIEGFDNSTNLQTLDLSQNQIGKIEGLDNLTNLQTLFLSENQIGKIEGLDNLTNLQTLDLSQNQISKTEGLEILKNIEMLLLEQNQIYKIEGLEKLNKIQILDLSQNQISEIERLGILNNLQILNLSENPIKDISSLHSFLKYSGLKTLWTEVSMEWGQTPHKVDENVDFFLDISGMKTHLMSKKGVYLKDCQQLVYPPPEWVQLGHKAVIDYFEAIEEQGAVTLNEAKVMIVGRPHAGKTSLSCKLRNSNAKMPDADDSTRGIEVENWNFDYQYNNYVAYLWDFGGQDVQYSVHQFFMTQRAIYLLVDCTRDPEQSTSVLGESKSEVISNYWLQTIQNVANGSPTFYVYNLYKDYASKQNIFQGLERQYDFLHKYPFELDINAISSDNDADINKVRNQLKEAIDELPNVGIVLPKKWMSVRQKLVKLSEERPTISLDKYLEICKYCGIMQEKAAVLVSRYFHEIGTIIHYSDDQSSPLYKLIILRRKWATEASYRVILDQTIEQEQKGRFDMSDLERIWSDDTYVNMTGELLALLERFEICYELRDGAEKTFLIPQSLPDDVPESIDEHLEDVVKIRYKYDFLPYGIVNRLTVRLEKYTDQDSVWKRGVIISENKGRVVVEEVKNFNQGFIRITVSGDKADRWFLQKRVMEELDDLNTKFNITDITSVQVPCTCENCVKKTDPYLHDYRTLVDMLKERITEERCGVKPFKRAKIIDLIDHAFFEQPEEVTNSLKSKDGLLHGMNVHVGDIIMGDKKGGVVYETPKTEISQSSLLESFHTRTLIGWWVVAATLAFATTYFPVLKPYMGLVFVLVGGIGTYLALTKESKYLRYSKWVLGLGLGIAAILNSLPQLAFTFFGGQVSDNGFIEYLGKFTMDERPLYTILLLLCSFTLAGFLAYLSFKDSEGTERK